MSYRYHFTLDTSWRLKFFASQGLLNELKKELREINQWCI